MNCKDFLNEFEDRNVLSQTATLHLNDCADCRKINGVQTRVWQIIDGFELVAAPNDFDFRVKAKIANAKPNDFHSASFPILRYVLGLSVVGLIIAFVIFNGFYSFSDKTVPQIAETKFQVPIQTKNPPNKVSENEQIAGTDGSQDLKGKESVADVSGAKPQQIENKNKAKTFNNKNQLIAVKSTKLPPVNPPGKIEKSVGGSQDSALRSSTQSLMPKGIPNSTQTNKNPSGFDGANPFTAEQILLQLGIESVAENGQRRVKKIRANSVGEHSDVRVGDIIEAIDGEKLTSEPIRAKTIEGKKLTVIRGAEKKEILLHN